MIKNIYGLVRCIVKTFEPSSWDEFDILDKVFHW